MALIPGYNYEQQVKIVDNDETTINNTVTDQAAEGYSLTNLIDKPASSQVYLIFSRLNSSFEA